MSVAVLNEIEYFSAKDAKDAKRIRGRGFDAASHYDSTALVI